LKSNPGFLTNAPAFSRHSRSDDSAGQVYKTQSKCLTCVRRFVTASIKVVVFEQTANAVAYPPKRIQLKVLVIPDIPKAHTDS
jgi:deoxycytidylate deaminase